MSKRHDPIKESECNLRIAAIIEGHKERSGRPPEVSHYKIF